MKLVNVLGFLLVLTAAGCAVSPEGAEHTEAADGSDIEPVLVAESALRASEVDAVPVYFNHDNHFAVADDATSIYGRFDSNTGKRVRIELHVRPGAAPASVRLKLYSVSRRGDLRLERTVHGRRGAAWTTLTSRGTGAYVVKMTSSGALSDLVLSVSCDGDSCSPSAQPGDFCGSRGGIACAEGLYCNYPVEASCGADDRGGVCSVRPEACTKEYAPVCGCDGQTYANTCQAAASLVSVRSDGACGVIAGLGESCGGFRRGPIPVCAQGLYCNYAPEDICGFADAPGTCAEVPTFCTAEISPVCGCDGRTYQNACKAAQHGVAVREGGACAEELPN